MSVRHALLLLAGLFLAGCESYSAPRYGVSADDVVALRAMAPTKVKVGPFTEPKQSVGGCRMAGPITAGDGMGFAAYIGKALSDELKVAGLYDDSAPVTLTGTIDNLAFSSSVAFWDIALTVRSSNGKSVSVNEHYEFPSSFTAAAGCQRVANAYFPAVQDLLQKLVKSPDFRSLLQN